MKCQVSAAETPQGCGRGTLGWQLGVGVPIFHGNHILGLALSALWAPGRGGSWRAVNM